MSLINKMLTDLDSRIESFDAEQGTPHMLSGLEPANEPHGPRRPLRPLLLFGLLCAVVAAASAYWASDAALRARAGGAAPVEIGTGRGAPPDADPGRAATSEAVSSPARRPEAPATKAASEADQDPPPSPASADPADAPAPGPETVSRSGDGNAIDPPPARRAAPAPPAQTTKEAEGPARAADEGTEVHPPLKTTRTGGAGHRALYHRAVRRLDDGRVAEAEALLRRALKLHPAHIEARRRLADLMFRQGRWREAEIVLAQGLALERSPRGFARALARLYVARGETQRAVALLEGSLDQAGEDPDFIALLAALYQELGRHAEAAGMYRRALALQPLEGRWWAGLGISLEATGDLRAARDAYLRVPADAAVDAKLAGYAGERLRAVLGQLRAAPAASD